MVAWIDSQAGTSCVDVHTSVQSGPGFNALQQAASGVVPIQGGNVKTYEMFIGGKWSSGRGETFPAVNPYNGETWATIPAASASDVDAAVTSAHEAFEEVWRRTSGLQRAEMMFRLADLIDRDAERLANIETTDNGKVVRETRNQMRFTARNYRFFGGCADKLTGETKPLDNYASFDYTTREPLGVIAIITAWNSPLALLANKLAPALAAGNTVVVKPSEYTSASTLEFARLIEEGGFPPGVFNVVTGGPDVGQAMITHPLINKVSFTGSVATGSKIAQAAAEAIVPVTLELGGKSANIIFGDADLNRALPGAVAGIFAAAGQTCIAGSRLLVHRSIYDEVVDGVTQRALAVRMGDPLDLETEMGPVAHRAQLESISTHISRARQDGAELLAGGTVSEDAESGLFVTPTVFGEVRKDMSLAQEEVFGPVLAVLPFSDDQEAIDIANDTQYGLAGGIWTRDLQRAHTVAKELRCGTVWVNTYRSSAAQAPFGGVKKSGYGRERGTEALDAYTTVKNVMIDLSDEARDPFTLKA